MKTLTMTCAIAIVLSGIIPSYAGDALPVMNARFGGSGLERLEIDEQNILADGAFKVTLVRTAEIYRNPHEMEQPYVPDTRTFHEGSTEVVRTTFDGNRLTNVYEWGQVDVVYEAAGNRLDLTIRIRNDSRHVIEQVAMHLMQVNLHDETKVALPYLSSWQGIRRGFNVGEVTLQTATNEEGMMILASPQPNKPIVMQIRKTGEGAFDLIATSGSDNHLQAEVYEGVWNVRPIRPGESETIKLSLLFGPAGIDPYTLAADVCRRFGEEFPMVLDWPDRRPIGAAWLAGHASTETNPRGWWNHILAGTDINTDEGREMFKERIMAFAQGIVNTAHRGGYQGVIIWDLEGAQNPHPITYIGDPRVLKYLAPEMEEVADAFFKRMTDAGLRVGLTIRPHLPMPIDAEGKVMDTWEGYTRVAQHLWGARPPHASEAERNCPVERLSAKIRYARERWGTTIFYVDSNYFSRPRALGTEGGAWSGRQMGAHLFKELHRRHPDVLIVPEHQHTEYWAYTAQYSEPPRWGNVSLNDIRSAYPDAISMPFISNGQQFFDENRALLGWALRRGDIPLIHGWYYGGGINILRDVYKETLQDAIQVYVDSEDNISLQGENVVETQLAGKIAELAEGKPLEQRRVFVKHHKNVAPTKVNQILKLIADGHGIISWSQISDAPSAD